ncbi:hypothetical protein MSAN_01311900 [Mycena sanguinolenta]|uniref:Uncharacterized protein n=1 Tax=Mycena sanguinolenta TaxID=230812 RepID=A0A8H6YES3_9AGAR|nr:hypothetical protein MSAN_01311900 [Mycena sanguinolenta]
MSHKRAKRSIRGQERAKKKNGPPTRGGGDALSNEPLPKGFARAMNALRIESDCFPVDENDFPIIQRRTTHPPRLSPCHRINAPSAPENSHAPPPPLRADDVTQAPPELASFEKAKLNAQEKFKSTGVTRTAAPARRGARGGCGALPCAQSRAARRNEGGWRGGHGRGVAGVRCG